MARNSSLITVTSSGLFCKAGNFYIDPWRPVSTAAIITHAHSDHARLGHDSYYCAPDSLPLLQHRLGHNPNYYTIPYGKAIQFGKASVSLHPAGHILGSAQVRIEVDGEVWVVSGDYKRAPDPTCLPFEVVPCDTLITEATFALPIYRWQPTHETAKAILDWWMNCREKGRTALLFCYALGKAQRVLSELQAFTDDPVYLHGAVHTLTEVYRSLGVTMLPTVAVSDTARKKALPGELVLAPPSAFRSLWMKRFDALETAFASGWMRVRANRRHRGYDRGFILSDHADWPQLIQTIQETGANQVLVTHGKSDVLVNYLEEQGYQASALSTVYGDEEEGTE